ncbi:MAG: NUDIX hydrolase [Sulfurimonas sp.]
MSFTPKTPYLTTDGIVEIYDKDENFLGIVLIERKYPPLGFALPGGFVDIGERVEDALVREMHEEISLDVEITELLGIYSDPSRDPRFHTVSAVYIAKAYGLPKAADDAKEVHLLHPKEIDLSKLVFDHAKILQDYFKKRGF